MRCKPGLIQVWLSSNSATKMAYSSLLLAASLLASPTRLTPLENTFELLNPAALGQHLVLQLQDLIGPQRAPELQGQAPAKVLALVLVNPGQCHGLDSCGQWAAFGKYLAQHGGRLLLLERGDPWLGKKERPVVAQRLPVLRDPRGLAQRLLNFNETGSLLLFNQDGAQKSLGGLPSRANQQQRQRYYARLRSQYLAFARSSKETQ